MATYTFDTLLTGAGASDIGTSFLSSGVVFATQNVTIVSLSTNDTGISYNKFTFTPSLLLSSYTIATINVAGSVFTVPSVMSGDVFGITKVDGSTSVFTLVVGDLSAGTTYIPASAITADASVWNDRKRFLRLYGYI